MGEVRILSIQQPYAELIFRGVKWCENRTWATSYRGPLYIHASRRRVDRRTLAALALQPDEVVYGAILGSVELVDCIDIQTDAPGKRREAARADILKRYPDLPSDWTNLSHVEGPICWILRNPVRLDSPISALGRLNLWRADLEELKSRPPAPLTPRRQQRQKPRPPSQQAIERPPGRVSGPLFDLLQRAGETGKQLTPDVLKTLAAAWDTTSGNVLATLQNNREFQRVPGARPAEQWWRVRGQGRDKQSRKSR